MCERRFRESTMAAQIMDMTDSIASKIETTLSITVASQLVGIFSKSFRRWDIIAGLSIVVSFIQTPSDGATVYGSKTLGSITRIFVRICKLAFVQTLLDALSPSYSTRRSSESIMSDIDHPHRNGGNIGTQALTAIPLMESLIVSSMTVIFITFVSRVIDSGSGMEFQRLIFGVQYAFSSSLAQLFPDKKIRMFIAFLGAVFLPTISKVTTAYQKKQQRGVAGGFMSFPAVSTLTGGMIMAWVNVSIQMIVPDSRWTVSPGMEILTALSLAIFLQSWESAFDGIGLLQGYIQWHLVVVIMGVLSKAGIGYASIVGLCMIAYPALSFASSLFPR